MSLAGEIASNLGRVTAVSVLTRLGINPDFSAESLTAIDRLLTRRRQGKAHPSSGLGRDTAAQLLCLGCYAGEVFLGIAEGRWVGLEEGIGFPDWLQVGVRFTGVADELVGGVVVHPVLKVWDRFHRKASLRNSLEAVAFVIG